MDVLSLQCSQALRCTSKHCSSQKTLALAADSHTTSHKETNPRTSLLYNSKRFKKHFIFNCVYLCVLCMLYTGVQVLLEARECIRSHEGKGMSDVSAGNRTLVFQKGRTYL